jgi:hypothetical protein
MLLLRIKLLSGCSISSDRREKCSEIWIGQLPGKTEEPLRLVTDYRVSHIGTNQVYVQRFFFLNLPCPPVVRVTSRQATACCATTAVYPFKAFVYRPCNVLQITYY